MELGTYNFKTCGNPDGKIICDSDTFTISKTGKRARDIVDFDRNIIIIIILSLLGTSLFILYLYNKEEYYLTIMAGILFVLAGVYTFSGLDGMFDKLIVDSIGVILIGLGLFNLGEAIWRFFPEE